MGREGRVGVRFFLDCEGVVRKVFVEHSTDTIFNAASIAAIRKCRFEPARVNGKPIGVWASLTIEFSLHPHDIPKKPKRRHDEGIPVFRFL